MFLFNLLVLSIGSLVKIVRPPASHAMQKINEKGANAEHGV
jgi:hypothetical protein